MTRRRWLIAAVALALLAAGGLWLWSRPTDLDRLRADLDRTEPGWRVADIWAARLAAQPADGKHATKAALDVLPLPAEYVAWQKVTQDDPDRDIWRVPADKPWPADAERVAAWRAAGPTVAAARTAADRPPGVVLTALPPDLFSVLLRHVSDARAVVNLLLLDAVETGDAAGAVASVRAALNIGRSVAAEPFPICTLVRRGVAAAAADAVLRGLPKWADADLARVQHELAAEADPALVVAALRDERACVDRQMDAVAAGDAGVANTLALSGPNPPPRPSAFARVQYRLTLADDQLAALKEFTALLAVARRPAHEWEAALAAVPLPPDDRRHALSHATGALARDLLVARGLRHLATLRAAVLAVGCERFRRANGRWPASAAELPADLVPADVTDPYTGRPLLIKRTGDGLAVYSVGPDKQDDGGTFAHLTDAPVRQDIGWRLWDEPARKGPP